MHCQKKAFSGPLSIIALAATLALITTSTSAADIAPRKYETLKSTAKTQGFSAVKVLLVKFSLEEIKNNKTEIAKKAQEKSAALLSKLGSEALPESRSVSSLGIMNLLVTERGLELLKESQEVVSFTAGDGWNKNIMLPDLDGGLNAIDEELARGGIAAVEVVLNVEAADFDLPTDNASYKLKLTKSQGQEALAKAGTILAGFGFKNSSKNSESLFNKNLKITSTETVASDGKIGLQVDRRALHSLARNKNVLAIKPVNFPKQSVTTVDPYATTSAKMNGTAEVLIQLSLPFFSGHASTGTKALHAKKYRGIFDEVFSGISLKKPIRYMPEFGAAIAHLSLTDIERLQKSGDRRIVSIIGNKPGYNISLATSTAQLGLPSLWPAGYTGAGQTIYVVDAGIEKSHPFLKQADGSSKVVFEACFQTDSLSYKSSCPDKDLTTGNSFGAGSGEPWPLSVCDQAYTPSDPVKVEFKNRICSHGTHVAGIAAGKFGATDVSIQGVAPEANLGSISILSRSQNPTDFGNTAATIFEIDWIEVLYRLSVMTAGTGNHPSVINMSLGGFPRPFPVVDAQYDYPYPTGGTTLISIIAALKQAAVPVVAAMGNFTEWGRMDVPAAVPGVIKVGSTFNDGIGMVVDDQSNRGRTDTFAGEYIFFAPGNPVRSAVAYEGNSGATGYVGGSSMATPHVSGVYALLKSLSPTSTLDEISDFIVVNYSHPVYARACIRNNNDDCDYEHEFRAIGLANW